MEECSPRQIVVVDSPSLLPNCGRNHATVVDTLCRDHQLVVLLQFGDERYKFPRHYILPPNAKLIDYDYHTLEESLAQLEKALAQFGVDVTSRHGGHRLPFVLGGSILQIPRDVQLSFFTEVPSSTLNKAAVSSFVDAEWDL